jgi:hypothetical protein
MVFLGQQYLNVITNTAQRIKSASVNSNVQRPDMSFSTSDRCLQQSHAFNELAARYDAVRLGISCLVCFKVNQFILLSIIFFHRLKPSFIGVSYLISGLSRLRMIF